MGAELHADTLGQWYRLESACPTEASTALALSALPPSEIIASDARIQTIKSLEEELKKAVGDGNLTTEMGERWVKLYKEEKLETYIGYSYTRAALIYAMFGV